MVSCCTLTLFAKEAALKRVVYHVISRGDRWAVREEGAKRTGVTFKEKSQAVEYAKELARGAAVGKVTVHGRSGKIQEYLYFKHGKRSKKKGDWPGPMVSE